MDIASTVRTEIREVLSREGKHLQNQTIYVFKCIDCGKDVFSVKCKLKLLSGRCLICANSLKSKKKPFESLYKHLLAVRNLGMEIDISYDDFVNYTNINKCHYCLSPITWAKHNIVANSLRYNLDRKDNSRGYLKDNLVVCCWRCNKSKGNSFSYEDWYGMTKYLRDKKKEP